MKRGYVKAHADVTGDLPLQTLSVRIVLKAKGWILEKMASRLAEHLTPLGIKAEIADYPSPAVDLNHWMIYYDIDGALVSRNTLAITHVDRPAKLKVLETRLRGADLGVCMSRMTLEQLVKSGIPREKLCYILPAHDNDVVPNRIVIGLTTQIRNDGAKRESILIKAAQSMRLDAFHFSIVGPRWERIIGILQAAGATVDYSPGSKENDAHRRIVLERLAGFDYFLYMGWDEGSMGLMDALAAGIPTIVTPQGFHLDIRAAITYPIVDQQDLCSVFSRLASERQVRIDEVGDLTWERYARDHALLWRAICAGQTSGLNALVPHVSDGLPPIDLSTAPIDAANPWSYARGRLRNLASDARLLWRLRNSKP